MGWLRHIRTTQELRKCAATEAEGVRVRSKRKKRSIPNYFWDMLNWSMRHRSWKRHRKTQYKITEGVRLDEETALKAAGDQIA